MTQWKYIRSTSDGVKAYLGPTAGCVLQRTKMNWQGIDVSTNMSLPAPGNDTCPHQVSSSNCTGLFLLLLPHSAHTPGFLVYASQRLLCSAPLRPLSSVCPQLALMDDKTISILPSLLKHRSVHSNLPYLEMQLAPACLVH